MEISIDVLRQDGGTQPRAQLNADVISEYASEMLVGSEFPDVIAFYDGESYWLADGFHRVEAAKKAGKDVIATEVRQGSRRDAVLYSCGVNAAHGLRRTNEDKRRAVMALLNDSEWSQWSDREIARRCAVSDRFVNNLRRDVTANDSQMDSARKVNRGGITYTQNTGNIGKHIVGGSKHRDISDSGGRSNNVDVQQGSESVGRSRMTQDSTPHVSHNSGEIEWYTPAEYLAAAREVMGGIDCDPASSVVANRLVRAETFYTVDDDGLSKKWYGRVWLNPPYAQPVIKHFCEALIAKFESGEISEGCLLTNNSTETASSQNVLGACSAVCFVRGRIRYIDKTGKPNNTPLQGQMVAYFGANGDAFAEVFRQFGVVFYG